MEMFEFALKFVAGFFKHYDLYLIGMGAVIILLNGFFSGPAVIGWVTAIIGGVICAKRRGLLDKLRGSATQATNDDVNNNTYGG